MLSLRPYQLEIREKVLAGFQTYSKQLVVEPTGAGKTIQFADTAAVLQPKRTLILAHREELIDQAIDKIRAATGIEAQKEMAEHKASLSAPVVVASIQSMGRRLDQWPKDHFGLVVADEAHHAISASWQRVLRHFDSHAWVLGVTATPDRGDKKNLGKYFENIAAEIALFDLINQGYLSRIAVKSLPLQIDIRGVKSEGGDYAPQQLGDALEPYLERIAHEIKTHADFRRILVFVPLIATSLKFVEVCRSVGINAAHIDGGSPDRKEILKRYAAGEIELLSNAMLLTEGFDDPGIDCVAILRATRSRSLYSQMVGRGTRIAPAKQNLLLLDFLWLHEKHNLIRPAHLVATCDEEAEEITELAELKAGGESQADLDLENLATEAQAQREEKLRKELEAKAKRKSRTVDAMEFCLSLRATDAVDYEPSSAAESEPPSKTQLETLERNGFYVNDIKFKGHASKILELLHTRQRMNLATPKQLKYLKQFGYQNPDTATFEQASAYLDKKFGKRKEVTPA